MCRECVNCKNQITVPTHFNTMCAWFFSSLSPHLPFAIHAVHMCCNREWKGRKKKRKTFTVEMKINWLSFFSHSLISRVSPSHAPAFTIISHHLLSTTRHIPISNKIKTLIVAKQFDSERDGGWVSEEGKKIRFHLRFLFFSFCVVFGRRVLSHMNYKLGWGVLACAR